MEFAMKGPAAPPGDGLLNVGFVRPEEIPDDGLLAAPAAPAVPPAAPPAAAPRHRGRAS